MRTGPKKALSLLLALFTRRASGVVVKRPQERENYQDGDRSQTELWNDRPYLDVEEPHMDADLDLDAEKTDEPAKRLSMEPVVRQAVMELVAKSEDADTDADPDDSADANEHYDSSGEQGGVLWPRIAPLVDAVLDLMLMYDNRSQFDSSLESSSVPNKAYILFVADKAEKLDFGYRRAKKDWDKFRELVPAVSGVFREEYKLGLLEQSLRVMYDAVGTVTRTRFASEPKERGFDRHEFGAEKAGAGGLQEFYEGYVPGEVPRQKTLNIKRMIALAKGKTGGMVEEIANRLGTREIVDFSTGKVNTKRLQGLLRYVVDQPDSELALTIITGTMVREVIRQSVRDEKGNHPVQFDADGAQVRLNISPSQLLSNMQGGTKDVVDEWLGMVISILSLVDVLPPGDEEETQSRIRDSLAKMGIDIAQRAFQGLHGKSMERNPRDPRDPRDPMDLVENALEKFDDAVSDDDIYAAIAAAKELNQILSGLGAIDMSAAQGAVADLEEIAEARKNGKPEPKLDMKALRRTLLVPVRSLDSKKKEKAASMTVADIAKRIVAPAKVRVVTQDEAEDGIELGDGNILGLPAKRHAARLAIGG